MSVENCKFTDFPQPRLFDVRLNVGFAWNLVTAMGLETRAMPLRGGLKF